MNDTEKLLKQIGISGNVLIAILGIGVTFYIYQSYLQNKKIILDIKIAEMVLKNNKVGEVINAVSTGSRN